MNHQPIIMNGQLESIATWITTARPSRDEIVAVLATLVHDCGGEIVLSEGAMRKTILDYCSTQPSLLVAASRLTVPLTTMKAIARGQESIPDIAAAVLGYQRQIIYRKKG